MAAIFYICCFLFRSVLFVVSLKLNDFLTKNYFIVKYSIHAAFAAADLGLVCSVVVDQIFLDKFYVKMIAIGPILSVLFVVILYYVLMMPAYISVVETRLHQKRWRHKPRAMKE